jgi:hypothetical protein
VLKFERTESAGFDFLISDLDLAFTLARIAKQSGENAAKRARNLKNARRAYDTVEELSHRVALTGTHHKEFHDKLQKLKAELEQLGEAF